MRKTGRDAGFVNLILFPGNKSEFVLKLLEVRSAVSKEYFQHLGQIGKADIASGFICEHDLQDDENCLDYEVRYCCTEEGISFYTIILIDCLFEIMYDFYSYARWTKFGTKRCVL